MRTDTIYQQAAREGTSRVDATDSLRLSETRPISSRPASKIVCLRALVRLVTFSVLPVLGVATGEAQIYDPVQWRLELDAAEAPPDSTVLARLTATIEDGWHVYSTTSPAGIVLGLQVAPSDAIKDWRAYQPEPELVYDPNFEAEVEWYTHEAVFLLELDLYPGIEGIFSIEAHTRYAACDDRQCLPPKRKSASATLSIDADVLAPVAALPAGYQPAKLNAVRRPSSAGKAGTGSPDTVASSTAFESQDQDLFGFALVALGFGFLAILTPCVFPMIPIYMGSFMGGGATPWGAVLRQAGVFCVGVIVLFTALGGVLASILGPFGLSQIGSNAWVNLLISAVLCFFALSMLGAFEIILPSSWTTGASTRSAGSGVLATLMLSVVFTLASFACTGPFIGTLLAGSVVGGSVAFPILGMMLFATGLSTPFFVLALFPALLNKLPRSGGWLAVTKRTLGFVILAVALKYLSNVDQVFGWELLTRERFLAIWIVLFALTALYLWGVVRLGGEGPMQSVGLVRLGTGAAFLAVSISLVPGMLGGRLGELDAHVPEASNSGWGAASGAELRWLKDDYEGALAEARGSGKTLLISFTGYACSNCKWMKANMFTKPEVRELLGDMILVELYTDGLDELSEKHQQLQVEEYRSSSIPFYALLRPDGSVAATFSGQTRDVERFRGFLVSAS